MSGDFLDNLTQRMGEPEGFALQPRLASRFENLPSMQGGLIDEPLGEDAADQNNLALARPAASEPTAKDLPLPNPLPTPLRLSSPRTLDSDPVAAATVTPPQSQKPEGSPRDRNEGLAARLDAVTLELDRMAGQIREAHVPMVEEHRDRPLAPRREGSEQDRLPVVERTTAEHAGDSPPLGGNRLPLVAAPAIERTTAQPPALLMEHVDAKPGPGADEAGGPLTGRESAKDSDTPRFRAVDIPCVEVQPADRSNPQQVPDAQDPLVPEIRVESRQQPAAGQRTVNVTIGRIEVRAVQAKPAAAPQRRPAASRTIMSLDEYLQRRAGGCR